MPDSVASLQSAIVDEANFDVTPTQALVWLNRSWRRMVGESRAFRQWLSFGQTVAGQSFYAVAGVQGVLEMYALVLGGEPHKGEWAGTFPYARGRRGDSLADLQGRLWWSHRGDVGLFEPNVGLTGDRGVNLIPTPSETGVQIYGFCAVTPPDLTADSNGNSTLEMIAGREEISEGLIAGALAIGYSREGNVPLADRSENVFERDRAKLERTTRRRFRGPSPVSIRMVR